MATFKVVLTYSNYPTATQTVYLTGSSQSELQTFLDSNLPSDTTSVISATDIGGSSITLPYFLS